MGAAGREGSVGAGSGRRRAAGARQVGEVAERRGVDASALAARAVLAVCHDFAAPLGALVLGVELLGESGQTGGDAFDLLRDGARDLQARLDFLRVAFAQGGGEVESARLETAARGLFSQTKAELVWRAPTSAVPTAMGGLILQLAHLCGGALPSAGTVTVSMMGMPAGRRSEPCEIVALAAGAGAHLRPAAAAGLASAPPPHGPAGDWVRAACVRGAAEAIGAEVGVESGEDWVRFIARLAAAP